LDKYKIDTYIQEEFEDFVDPDHLIHYVVAALEAEGIAGPAELGVAVVDDEQVHELNREYRGYDEPTDVLSFAMEETEAQDGSLKDDFVSAPDGVLRLGEVIIAYPFSLREAMSMGRLIDRHVAHLVVHGVLHILGYDHEELEDEMTMRAREEVVLGWPVYYPGRD